MFPKTDSAPVADTSLGSSGGTKTYLFDFETGEFVIRDGKMVECDGVDAIKVWIEKIIRTEKNRYKIYTDTEYGCHLEDLIIGNSYTAEFVEAELKREIEDALLQNPQIQRVGGFSLVRGFNSITVTLEVYIDGTGANTVTVTVAN